MRSQILSKRGTCTKPAARSADQYTPYRKHPAIIFRLKSTTKHSTSVRAPNVKPMQLSEPNAAFGRNELLHWAERSATA
jgi:hypothetical protein